MTCRTDNGSPGKVIVAVDRGGCPMRLKKGSNCETDGGGMAANAAVGAAGGGRANDGAAGGGRANRDGGAPGT